VVVVDVVVAGAVEAVTVEESSLIRATSTTLNRIGGTATTASRSHRSRCHQGGRRRVAFANARRGGVPLGRGASDMCEVWSGEPCLSNRRRTGSNVRLLKSNTCWCNMYSS